MPQIIEVPGYGNVEFPDEMTDQQIAAAIQRTMQPQSPRDRWSAELERGRAVPEEAAAKPQEADGFAGGRLHGALMGVRDPINEAAALLPKGLAYAASLGGNLQNPASNWLESEARRVQALNRVSEQGYQTGRAVQGREGFDWPRLGGNIASPANLVPATRASGLLTRGAQAAGAGQRVARAAGATGAGATYGLLSTSEDQDIGDKTSQVLIGAALGPVAEFGAQGVGALLRPAARDAQNLLIREGVTLTPGQYIGGLANTVEQKLMSVPLLGDAIAGARKKGEVELNRAVADRALAPIGQTLPKEVSAGHEAAQHVRKTLQAEYDRVLPTLSFAPDEQFIAELQNITQMVRLLPEPQARQFEAIFQDRVLHRMTQYGRMGGESFKPIESDVRQLAQKYMRSSTTGERELGSALGELLASLRRGLIRNNPEQAPQLTAINEGWANYARLRRASASQAADEGVFTPAQLNQAVRAEDVTKGKRAYSEGEALMQDLAGAARGVMQTRYPDSGTAGRLMMGGGLLGSAAISPAIPLGVAAASVPYLLRRPTQAALQGADALARPSAEFLANYGQYGALPLLIPSAQ